MRTRLPTDELNRSIMATGVATGGGGAHHPVLDGAEAARVGPFDADTVVLYLHAVGGGVFYAPGDGTVTATSAAHYLPEGETQPLTLHRGQTHLSLIREGDDDVTVHISERR